MDVKCFICGCAVGDNPPMARAAADCCELCHERSAAYQEAAQDAFDEIRGYPIGGQLDETEALNDRYQIYLDCANDRNGKLIKTFDQWLNS